MNKFYIQPRQTGKTTSLVRSMMKFTGGCALIVKNHRERLRISDDLIACYSKDYMINKAILIPNDLPRLSNNIDLVSGYKKYFVDEYLFFDHQQRKMLSEFYRSTYNANENIGWEIRTTSDRLYNPQLMELTRNIKHAPEPFYILRSINKLERRQISERYWDNFLTEPTFKVQRLLSFKTPLVSKEAFDTEIMGEYLLSTD